MSLIFLDSFDHYDTATAAQKWTTLSGGLAFGTGEARTGPGCWSVSSFTGPEKLFGNYTNLLAATNWNCDSPGYALALCSPGAGGLNALTVAVQVNANGSVSIITNITSPSPPQLLLGTTAPLLVIFNVYNSIALRATCDQVNGEVDLWINGVLQLSLTNVNTSNAFTPGLNVFNGFRLLGPGGLPKCFHDDVYALDCSSGDTYRGPSRIYASVPYADGAPIQWAPLAAPNFSQVNEIPPDGDASYNAGTAIGQVDQYLHDLSGVPAGAQLQAVQHVMSMEVSSGARAVASDVAGVAGAGIGLASGYSMFTTPYDVNPATTLPWQPADFPLGAGPKVTA